jgi:hypothetical protein
MNQQVKEALASIESAMNAAISKGTFINLESAAYIFNCLKIVKDAIEHGGSDSHPE